LLPDEVVEFFHFWAWGSSSDEEENPEEPATRRLQELVDEEEIKEAKLVEIDIYPTSEEEIKGLHSAGYESKDIVSNLGTLYVIVLISGILILFLPFFKVMSKYMNLADRVYHKIYNMFFWNGMMLFFLEGYLELSVDTMLNLKMLIIESQEAGGFSNLIIGPQGIISILISTIFALL